MKRKFVTNLALLIFLNLLIKPFWIFGIDRTVQNVVGAEEFGFYISLFNFSMLLNILLDLGVTSYNNRNIAQNTQLLSKHVSNIVVLKFILAVVYFVICILAALIIGYEWKHLQLLFLLIFNQFLISFILYLRSNLSGLHLFKTDSLISVLDRIIMIIICGILLWGHVTEEKFKIEWFVYSQTAAYLFTTLITFLAVLARTKFLRLHFDRNFFLVFLRQSYPYALLVLLMSFYNRIDSVMLERLLPNGDEQAGIYAQAFRILDAATMFSFLFAVLLMPIYARMIKQKDPVEQLTQLSYLLLIIPAITIAITSLFYRVEIMDLLYHTHVSTSSDIFGILILGYISISTTYIFGTLLTANGSMRQLNIMAGIGMAINIILNLILIPRFWALGSAIASLITQTLTAAAQVLIAKKIFGFKINFKLLTSLLVYVIGICGIGFLTREFIHNWYIGFFVMGGLCLILAIVTKLLNLKNLYRIFRYDESG